MKLVPSLVIIAAFQVLIALPFIYDPASRLMGFPNGAQTSIEDYLHFTRIGGGKDNKQRGASKEFTLYWHFLEDKVYNDEPFLNRLKGIILAINVYFFFIRSGCLYKCILNINPG